MRHRKNRSRNGVGKARLKAQRTLVLGALCLSLFLFGPHYQSLNRISITAGPVQAQNADAQGSTASDGAVDDTPSEQDIADFASEYDQDGDGEVDEPDDEEADESSEPDEADEADQEDDRDDGDDADDDQILKQRCTCRSPCYVFKSGLSAGSPLRLPCSW